MVIWLDQFGLKQTKVCCKFWVFYTVFDYFCEKTLTLQNACVWKDMGKITLPLVKYPLERLHIALKRNLPKPMQMNRFFPTHASLIRCYKPAVFMWSLKYRSYSSSSQTALRKKPCYFPLNKHWCSSAEAFWSNQGKHRQTLFIQTQLPENSQLSSCLEQWKPQPSSLHHWFISTTGGGKEGVTKRSVTWNESQGKITGSVEKYQFIRHWVLVIEQILPVIRKHPAILVICPYPAQHERCTSNLVLRIIAFGHKNTILPIMEQNRGCQVLRKHSSKEQTVDQLIVPEHQKTIILTKLVFLSHRDTDLLSAPQSDLSHMAIACWHLTSLTLHSLSALKAPYIKSRTLQN